MTRTFAILSAAVVLFAQASGSVQAQAPSMPEKCTGAASEMHMPMGQMMDMPMGAMMEQMHGIALQDFNEDYMQGMRRTMPLMMEGMLKDDADVAFVCGMIGHHMGAIEMSKTQLKFGKNEDAKALARKIIDAQVKEIEEMSRWVETHAK